MKFDWPQAYPVLSQGETYSKPLVGISACLCGDPVRYNGQDKGMPGLVEALEQKLTLIKRLPGSGHWNECASRAHSISANETGKRAEN